MCVLRLGLGLGSEMAAGRVVKVKREALEACMTCPLCHKLLKEATTVSLCLHTFCRKCIYEKLSDEESDCCPVCEIDLGCLPVEKLRPDNNLQDIRAKIFPLKRGKLVAPESPSVSLPAKRKERSLSALVVSMPKVSAQAGLTGKRSRALTRKAAALLDSRASKREESSEDHTRSGSSHDDEDIMQDSSIPETTYEQKPDKDDAEVTEGKGDLWTPLNCLVEAANRTKPSKPTPQGQLLAKSEPSDALDSISELYKPENKTDAESPGALENFVHVPKFKNKEPESSTRRKNNSNASTVSGTIKRKRYHFGNRNRGIPSVASGDSTQDLALVDVLGANKHSRRDSPIWFSLVAAENWKGEPSLPQISSCYLRIKDGKMPVTFIQKYLAKKLELTSDAEVEILCRGQPVHPTLQLHNVVDLWFQTESTTKRVPAKVGSSAKEFVMVLSYCRSVQNP